LKVFKIIVNDSEMKHVISVLCDSHGLNLFTGDVFKLEHFKNIDDQANALVVTMARKRQMAGYYKIIRRSVLVKRLQSYQLAIIDGSQEFTSTSHSWR
jgi:hypothetical protein